MANQKNTGKANEKHIKSLKLKGGKNERTNSIIRL